MLCLWEHNPTQRQILSILRRAKKIAAMLLFPGSYIGREYRGYKICSLIGQGRYGACFKAKAPDGSMVVLKRFHNHMRKKNADKNHFEAVVLSALNHPSIPSLLGVINTGSDYFYVLEHMAGKPIEQMLFQDHHRFTPREIYKIGLQLTSLIAYLHDRKIVHRDIRISNILCDNGKISLIDFGLARFTTQREYPLDSDFSYLGDFLLYLIYSYYPGNFSKKCPWYDELSLPADQTLFLKKLLGLETPYSNANQVKIAFCKAFYHS